MFYGYRVNELSFNDIFNFNLGMEFNHPNAAEQYRLYNVNVNKCKTGAIFNSMHDLSMNPCYFEDCDKGMEFTNSYNVSLNNLNFDDNTLLCFFANNCKNFMVNGTLFENTLDTGSSVVFQFCTGINIEGGSVRDTHTSGFVFNNCSNYKINGTESEDLL